MSNQVIVISRQFGSGGRKIGKTLSDRLKIPFYDMALIEMASKRSNADYEALLEVDEKRVSPRKWYSFPIEVGMEYQMQKVPMNEELFNLQAEIIKDLANQSPCIMIGRGADYILRGNERMLSVFIHADMETKKKIVSEHYNLSPEDAVSLIKKTDKQRATYYNYYTEYKWGDVDSYDITLDRSRFGIEKCVDILEMLYQTL
ncbi:MAG: cytidylate kinase-like family protein [Lachnospiraceae bacterium]|nr:cytidylate kinase-like family protein [Lachnospiraceae bacterium]MDD7148355.1 cytidylate kinase-like family protein [Lachnospiraceae bacterium]MDY4068648.1 cytidylate kinase-like family protein [Lachnospiraceae bacterium]